MKNQSNAHDLTHKRILNIALPVVLSNATVPILGAVDTAVVGQLGLAAPIGAVGIGAIIATSIYWIFGFLRMGTTGLAAQALGQGDTAESSALLVRSVFIGVFAGFVLILLQVPLFWAAFNLSPASLEVESLARDYLQIRLLSAPAAIAIYGLTGWLIAKERTKAVLVLQFWMNGVNIALDLLFVLEFGWGVEGVAVATFVAEWSALVLAMWMTREGWQNGAWQNWSQIFNRTRLIRMASVNRDIMIRSVLIQVAFVSFMFFGSSFDDVTLAANQVLLQFLYITAYSLDGFALAAESLVGQAFGAKQKDRLRRAVMLVTQWGVLTVVATALCFALFGEVLIGIMTTSFEVQSTAKVYLPWMVLAPLVGVASWLLDGIFIGATRGRDMRNSMFFSVVIYVVAVLVLTPIFGNHGLWAALLIFFLARGVLLGIRYPALEAATD